LLRHLEGNWRKKPAGEHPGAMVSSGQREGILRATPERQAAFQELLTQLY
jgi:hypothetical protein